MSLIVEDGTIIAGAESYLSVADADIYHANRGAAAWAALGTPAKEQALRKATDFMLGSYRSRWKGYRKDGTQTLDWPRTFVYLEPFVHGIVGTYPYLVSDLIVPVEVKNACAELALIASATPLAPNLTRSKLRVRVGPIETEYEKGAPEYTRFRAVDLMLSIYLVGSSANAALVRA